MLLDALIGFVSEQCEFGDVDPDQADAAAGGGEAAGVAADGVELARAQMRSDDSAHRRDGGELAGLFVRFVEDVLEFLRPQMAKWQLPDGVVFPAIPKTSVGKFDKKVLRQMFADRYRL